MPVGEAERREARARGRVAVSPLLSGAGALVGGAAAVALGARAAGARLAAFANEAFSGGLPAAEAVSRLTGELARVSLPVAGAALGGALVAGLIQSGGLFAPRAVGQRTGNERPARTLALALALATVVLGLEVARTTAAAIAGAPSRVGVQAALGQALSSLAGRALLLCAAAGLGDWVWRRLRMEARLGDAPPARGDGEAIDPRLRAELERRRRTP